MDDLDDLLPQAALSPPTGGEPLPISALAQYTYCPRRAALILLEGEWEDNEYTLRGARAHEQADIPEGLLREGVRIERALPLWSERLGLVGRADVVEFVEGAPYPVEYKVGRRWPRELARKAAEVQLCAQALCLEEMFGQSVPEGAIFSKASQRRRVVRLTPELRALTLATLGALRKLMQQERLPPPTADERCRHCSLLAVCMPEVPQALALWRAQQGS
ncbi:MULTISPECIES: CRISPR-associated protein Cas4 [unclassified Meiothermus]|uniref:CRISPR-associated protein Cas4 n=1 Tax=unclassified Meiothermus TaxID=370471 RepID=UPI000D7C2CE5|nr:MULTISPECIES: CRISPR-associated protein Cas4 [unclassified Meiothermus]PZA07714.1 CRISPR-associated protein Cas4 [Meiothermus sp. Pnk-1]RYM34472.1 CRISPR-associated protein Cas4 [Meiothermus sp. PNK-Is4]